MLRFQHPLAALNGENESRSEPSGECAWCQAGYVNDRGDGRRLGLSAPRRFSFIRFEWS
jgi:hypothetical protein